ncbi:MAG: hypothetical protein OEY01_16035 [Desulfobulbaceae bacterium]|nr:hypothetical protein [Desulfobulbaceae bacterium]
MKKLIPLIVLTLLFLIGFAVTAQAETPREASKAILELLTAQNYEKLFRTRYCELYKAKSEGEVSKAIKILSAYWEKDHETMINLFEQLSNGDFLISKHEYAQVTETGQKATCQVTLGQKNIPYTLYEMKNGLWGFHM